MKKTLLLLAGLGQMGFSQSVSGYWQKIDDLGTLQLVYQFQIDSAARHYESRLLSISSAGRKYHQDIGTCQVTRTYIVFDDYDDSGFVLDSTAQTWQRSTISDPPLTRLIASVTDTSLILQVSDGTQLPHTRISGFTLPDIRQNPFPNGVRHMVRRAGRMDLDTRLYLINGRMLSASRGKSGHQPVIHLGPVGKR